MLEDVLIAFLEEQLAADERRAHAAAPDWDSEDERLEWEDLPETHFAHARNLDPARILREVAAKRRVLSHEVPDLAEWEPASNSWVLNGPGLFAECWPDNTVNVWIFEAPDGRLLNTSGVQSRDSREACQEFAESWIRENLAERSPVVRALAAVYSDHPDYREEWRS